MLMPAWACACVVACVVCGARYLACLWDLRESERVVCAGGRNMGRNNGGKSDCASACRVPAGPTALDLENRGRKSCAGVCPE